MRKTLLQVLGDQKGGLHILHGGKRVRSQRNPDISEDYRLYRPELAGGKLRSADTRRQPGRSYRVLFGWWR